MMSVPFSFRGFKEQSACLSRSYLPPTVLIYGIAITLVPWLWPI
jgi:hypothetical protein